MLLSPPLLVIYRVVTLLSTTLVEQAEIGNNEHVVRLLERKGDDVDSADRKGRTGLIAAIKAGHEDVVDTFLKHGADTNRVTENGQSALILAVKSRNFNIVSNLLEHGADVNLTPNSYNWQAIDFAFQDLASSLRNNESDATARQSEIIKELLEHGADVKGLLIYVLERCSLNFVETVLGYPIDINFATNYWKRTALMAAAEGNRETVIEVLVQHNASVDQKDNYGQTALYKAALKGNSRAVLALLKHNANATIKNDGDTTPLMIAAMKGRREVVRVLLSNVDFSSWEKSIALEKAIDSSSQPDVTIINLLLKANAAVTSEALIMAAAKPSSSYLTKFLEIAPSAVLNDSFMLYNAVQSASKAGVLENVNVLLKIIDDAKIGDRTRLIEELSQAMLAAAKNGHASIVSLLLEKYDLDVDYAQHGKTALTLAAEQNRKEVVELLLEKGANISHVNHSNETALISVCRRVENDYLEVLKLLLANDASVNHQNDDGDFALFHAAEHGFIQAIEVLLSNGAQIDLRNTLGQTSLMRAAEIKDYAVVETLIENGANIEIETRKGGRTAFLLAAANNVHRNYNDHQRKTLDILFRAGADINKQDSTGSTALMLMLNHLFGNPGPQVVSFLLDLYPDDRFINVQNKKGETALMLAAEEYVFHDIVPVLLVAGARPELVDDEGLTALDRASKEPYANSGVIHRLKNAM